MRAAYYSLFIYDSESQTVSDVQSQTLRLSDRFSQSLRDVQRCPDVQKILRQILSDVSEFRRFSEILRFSQTQRRSVSQILLRDVQKIQRVSEMFRRF